MSAIYGVIQTQHNEIKEHVVENMERGYQNCVLDTYHNICGKNIQMGCGTKYITREDRLEKAPFYEKGIYFTADVYLDNREEIRKRLGKKQNKNQMSDARLLYECYKMFGVKLLDWVLGSYTFVAYHMDNNCIIAASDIAASRCLYYTYEENTFRFSTLLGPILNTDSYQREINERWMVDFCAQDSLAMTTECVETPYKGINKIQPGECIQVSNNEIRKTLYWNPVEEIKIQKRIQDVKAKEQFRECFEQAIKSGLRSENQTGLFLSGGLDSTSVASFVAPLCKQQKKVLQTYTAIPEKDYITTRDSYYVTNEKEQVLQTESSIGNIKSHFYDLAGENPYDDSDEMLEITEIPYKAVQNTCSMLRGLQQAHSDGCNIMLTGQYGNVTISYGDFDTYFTSLMRHGRIWTLWKQLTILKQKNHCGRKRILKHIIHNSLPKVRCLSGKYRNEMFQSVYVRPAVLEKYNVAKRFYKQHLNDESDTIISAKAARRYIYSREALSQVGELETKLSLATGVLIKDPTRDKRVITYCLSIPYSQLVKDGIERRLIREYLNDKIPIHILSKTTKSKGLQSADVIHRINKCWSRIRKEMNDLIEENCEISYLDMERVSKEVKQIGGELEEKDDYYIRKLLIYMINVKFIKKYKEKERDENKNVIEDRCCRVR